MKHFAIMTVSFVLYLLLMYYGTEWLLLRAIDRGIHQGFEQFYKEHGV